ncbi:hypothetical protein SDC9_75024 [bioreactor metagenome]|uniref:SPOR domain-containing protein n=1 Tax=bioreactor metagenome TaxID=1076179 RepID=A0A644YKI6_9ZZZZ
MNIIKSILTNNDCYKAGRTITVQGLMLHSVGCSQPRATVFIDQWNRSGVEKAVHGFIEPDGDVYQTLPWNHRGWHGGGASNNTHIGVEMTEPGTIKYTGGSSWTDLDPANTEKHVLGTYKTAVELFADLCKQFNLDPLADGVIISHSEGCKRGIASNHGDVEHIWNKFGLTMNQFRKDVKAAMNPVSTPSNGELYRVQTGAFSIKANADALLAKIKAAGFDTYMIQAKGLYKVQVGAYSVKANADAMMVKLKAAGFDAFITTEGGSSVSQAAPRSITVGSRVKVKPGAKSYNGGGVASFVYNGVYTVDELKGDRAVLDSKGICTPFKVGDLILQ